MYIVSKIQKTQKSYIIKTKEENLTKEILGKTPFAFEYKNATKLAKIFHK